MQRYRKNRVKLWEQIEFNGQKSVSTVFVGISTDFRCILQCSFTEMESAFIASKRVLTERYWPRITYSK